MHSVSSLPSMQEGSSRRAAFSSPVEENMKASVGCRRRTGLSGSEITLNKELLGELGMPFLALEQSNFLDNFYKDFEL